MATTPGVISEFEAYTQDEFRKRIGCGDSTFREIRRQLPVVVIGYKRFYLGRHWLDFLARQVEQQNEPRKQATIAAVRATQND